MRRKSRNSLVNLALFAIVLLCILYLGSGSSNKTFAWTTIRYKSFSAQLPQTRGICPGLADTSRPALVVARVAADGETSWLNKLAAVYHLCVYTVDAPADTTSSHLQVPANRGHEAMAYLTFIIDNYSDIPAAGAVMVHGSRFAWHNDWPNYDNQALLGALNVSAALSQYGYHNLKCDWSASTCSPGSGPPQGSIAASSQAILQPNNLRAVSDAALPGALASLFGGEEQASALLGRSHTVRAQCCAQFVVSRDSIWQHSQNEYIALRQWLLDSSIYETLQQGKAAPPDDRVAGRILSYVWHIMFVQQQPVRHPHGAAAVRDGIDLADLNKLACPAAQDCYCRLYDRCRLRGCDGPESCGDQYTVPPGFKLPDDWAATHS